MGRHIRKRDSTTLCRLYGEYDGDWKRLMQDEAIRAMPHTKQQLQDHIAYTKRPTRQPREVDRVVAITGRRMANGETPTRWFVTFASGLARWQEEASLANEPLLGAFEDANPDEDDVATEAEEPPRKKRRFDDEVLTRLARLEQKLDALQELYCGKDFTK